MRTIASAAVAAILTAAFSMPLSAQSQPEKGKDATKVYAYKKAANKSNVGRKGPPKAVEYLPSSVPYGSETWWEINGRAVGGAAD